MIVFSLRCAESHEFEGWFRDNAAYEAQQAEGGIACPYCGGTRIGKAPMAPRIGKSGEDKARTRQALLAEAHRKLAELRRHVEENCEYVGERFAAEARRIHGGETERRDIYGEATADEAESLADEGIPVTPLPWPARTDS